jgi:uncharacterized RDD family membrane protein YckC
MVDVRRVTPELASSEVLVERALAVALDALLIGLATAALATAVDALLSGVPTLSGEVRGDAPTWTWMWAWTWAAVAGLLWLAYAVWTVGRWGQTAGKFLTGVVVVDARGARPTYRAAAIRELLRVADLALVGLAYLPQGRRRRRLGDRLAGTAVVRARREERRL